MLKASDVIAEVRRDLDETSASNSFWSDADLVAYINRVLKNISSALPVRTAILDVTGDGTSQELEISQHEHVGQWRGLLDGVVSVPKIGYARALREAGAYGFLPFVFGDYGFSPVQFAGRQKVRIVPTLENGETRTIIAVSTLGKVKATPYSTGTVSITNDSATVTGSGTTWSGTDAVAGECIEINGHYYIIDSVDSTTQITLTENVREATASGLSYEIGDLTGLADPYQEMLIAGILKLAYRKDRDYQAKQEAEYIYNRELRKALSDLEAQMRPDHYVGGES